MHSGNEVEHIEAKKIFENRTGIRVDNIIFTEDKTADTN